MEHDMLLSTLSVAIIIALAATVTLAILASRKHRRRMLQGKREGEYISIRVEHTQQDVEKRAGKQTGIVKTETEAKTTPQLQTLTVESVNSQTSTKLTSKADVSSSNSGNVCTMPVKVRDQTSGLTLELIPVKVWKLAPPDKHGVKIGLFKSPITGKYFTARLPDDYPECESVNTHR